MELIARFIGSGYRYSSISRVNSSYRNSEPFITLFNSREGYHGMSYYMKSKWWNMNLIK